MSEGSIQSNWLEESKLSNKSLFSELDVLLRAVDRFFVPENLPLSKDSLADKNFRNELNAARDVILRVISILEAVIPENKKNAYWFQKFAGSKISEQKKRDSFKIEMYKQDTPERAFFLLYDSFVSLKSIVTDLIKSNSISYMSFVNVGEILSKHIRGNNFFNPFEKELNPEFDTIENRHVSAVVKEIKDKDQRLIVSTLFLQLFRFLRYLRFVDVSTQRHIGLHSSVLILILMKSELATFQSYADKAAEQIDDVSLKGVVQGVSYQFSMEGKRVYRQEMKDIFEKKAPQQKKGRVENSYGILKNLIEQAVIQIASHFNPILQGDTIFDSFVTKLEQSLKLREDIFILHNLLAEFVKRDADEARRARIFSGLKNYMDYFESFTYRLLRHDDYEEFVKFFDDIKKGTLKTTTDDERDEMMERCKYFLIYLETTLGHIGNRSELGGRPMDMKKAEAVIRQHLS